ncbi:PREDICTED: uncharacterized protein LOC109479434 [Branchiostoma belcheri]|uniref:Uncharacterized protein LOC109479434 n=1 Tax=Branchiostoma belcheri TaxID=7741 RepID=A0A6P5A5A5_BRABE|nr:PREDICTED: uncharacterized protein LOC109479434 [Branchiostoma belcheri]
MARQRIYYVVTVAMVLTFATQIVASKEAPNNVMRKLQTQGCKITDYHYVSKYNLPRIACDNIGLTSVPEGLPQNMAELQLPNNAITSFSCAGLNLFNLKILNLRNNRIRCFPWNCLKHMRGITALDLSHNQLSCVKLFAVKFFVPRLKMVNISYNRLMTLSECDLGWDMSLQVQNHLGHFVQYNLSIEGNPLYCSCSISWAIKLAKIVNKCRKKMCDCCKQFFDNENPIKPQMWKDLENFRCETPPRLAGLELWKLGISHCPQIRYSPCPIEHTCPGVKTEAYTSTFLPPTTTSSSELSTETSEKQKQTQTELNQQTTQSVSFEISFKPKQTQTELNQQTTQKVSFEISSEQKQTHTELKQLTTQNVSTETLKGMFLPTPGELYSVQSVAMPITEAPQTQFLSSPHPSPLETEVSTTTLLPTTASSSKLFTQTSEGPKQTRAELNQQTTQDVSFEISFEPKQTQTELNQQTTQNLKFSQSPQTQVLSSPHPSPLVSGWMLTGIIVGGIVALSGLILAVYCAMSKKQASQGNNMAAGYVVNNHQVDISQLQSAQVDSQAGYSGESDYASPYAKSMYVFHVPQYDTADRMMEAQTNKTPATHSQPSPDLAPEHKPTCVG